MIGLLILLIEHPYDRSSLCHMSQYQLKDFTSALVRAPLMVDLWLAAADVLLFSVHCFTIRSCFQAA